jgi:surfeit locus 1 family protein
MRSPATTDGLPARRFRPGLPATLCTIVALAILLGLGTWQVQRLQWKTELIDRVEAGFAAAPVTLAESLADPAGSDFHAATATGRYRHDLAFAIGAAGMDGIVGSTLVTPLETGDGALLLVERGWLPQALLPPQTPGELEPEGQVRLSGHLRDRSNERAGPFTPDNEPSRRRWFWYDLPALEQVTGRRVLPVVLTLDRPDVAGDRMRPMPLRVELPNNHLGYVITWYGLAVALVAVYIAFGLRRPGD